MGDQQAGAFRAMESRFFDVPCVTLSDADAGSEAIVVPSLGFACVAFRIQTPRGGWSVLAEPPDHDSLVNRTTRYGIPILYPWPNRIRDGKTRFGGRDLQFPLPPNGPHAIHGVARARAWTVDASGADAEGAFCRASIVLGTDADDVWPFATQLRVEYRLKGRELFVIAEAANLGSEPMPMGFGTHPWFGMPLGAGGSKETLEVRAPARAFWELDETLCSTGAVKPVSEGFDAREWHAIGDTFIDDVYTDLPLTDGWFTAEIRDPASGRRVAVRSDAAFREHVVFAPRHGQAVCLEPYTCATDAFNLDARGIDAGTIVMETGDTWRGVSVIEASS
ncbi:MAG: aldose 1-epimerase [Chloroflexi bacterium]|nr:aldose 1-epimerase [Chloroflexota bacterium]